MSLAWIPKGILTRIQSLYCKFLWQGNKQGKTFAWVRWEDLNLPKKWGGWGLKKLEDFSSTLVAKLGWHLVSVDNLWTWVTSTKYIAPMHTLDWIGRPHLSTSRISIIWKVVLKALNPIREGITWRIRSGNKVRIGLHPWVGCGNMHRLPMELTQHLHQQNITYIAQIADSKNTSFLQQAWKSAHQLNIPPVWIQHWEDFTLALTEAHI